MKTGAKVQSGMNEEHCGGVTRCFVAVGPPGQMKGAHNEEWIVQTLPPPHSHRTTPPLGITLALALSDPSLHHEAR
jgi:hypothetical protein